MKCFYGFLQWAAYHLIKEFISVIDHACICHVCLLGCKTLAFYLPLLIHMYMAAHLQNMILDGNNEKHKMTILKRTSHKYNINIIIKRLGERIDIINNVAISLNHISLK